jgi:predicted AAA+ superfamily ATPase
MLDRKLRQRLGQLLDSFPAVVLTGPRQVGKTTLAMDLSRDRRAIYLDLERPQDLLKTQDLEQFCSLNTDHLIILDEVQRVPELFAPLRSIIDQRKRRGQKTGQFLLLGSASIDLLKQSSESLAGRVALAELCALNLDEVPDEHQHILWHRGGFPDSYLAADDQVSIDWRQNFVRTYLERDIPMLGPRIPAETLRRFWTMLAHHQGQTFNASAFARSLDVKSVTTSRYLDLMVDLLLVRRLQPWASNTGKRLVKAPKIYIRDSGICHALLNIGNMNELLGHPVIGGSWEGFVIEQLAGLLPRPINFGFYRTTGGAEIDFVLEPKPGQLWAIEIKRSTTPVVSRGFHQACTDLKAARKIVAYPGDESFPLKDGIEVLPIRELMKDLESIS